MIQMIKKNLTAKTVYVLNLRIFKALSHTTVFQELRSAKFVQLYF